MVQALTHGPLSEISGTLMPLLAALRTVWIISRYYNDDERMGALLQRVAHTLADRCKAAIDLKVAICRSVL